MVIKTVRVFCKRQKSTKPDGQRYIGIDFSKKYKILVKKANL